METTWISDGIRLDIQWIQIWKKDKKKKESKKET